MGNLARQSSINAIATRELVKVFRAPAGRSVRALDGVDLEVAAGSVFGLIGPNGAGKTTLVKCLLDLVIPTGGACKLMGRPSTRSESRRGVGYLPENPQHPPYLTPRELLAFSADLAGCPEAGRGEAAPRLLERVGLAEAVDRKIRGFSKGMRQRMGLACALLGGPDILILDEPTDGVDPVGRHEIREILLEENRRGATVFLNSHLLAETERICGTVAILSRGRVIRRGPVAEIGGEAVSHVVELVGADGCGPVPEVFKPVTGSPGTFRLASPDLESVNAAIDEARRAGYLVSSMNPERSDLERVLLSALKEEQ